MRNKHYYLLGLLIIMAAVVIGCGGNEEPKSTTTSNDSTSKQSSTPAVSVEKKDETIIIDKLSVGFVPSRDPEEIITATAPLKNLLTVELSKMGYDVKDVNITVGTNYEAVGEALSAGTTDIGLIPGGTYVLYDDGAEVILTATRAGLNNDSDSPKAWNDNKPTDANEGVQATYYRALIIAGPSEKGQQLAQKVNNGEDLTFEDMNSASWSVMSSSSPAGYIYPALWLQERFDKTITDLEKIVQVDSYGSAFARLAAGQIDVLVTYADARRDNHDRWTAELGRTKSIWEETNVIGVTPGIYNDTISVSKNSKIMDDKLKAALQQAFINLAQTEEGKKVISIYNHGGYKTAVSADYDNERIAQKIVQSLK